MKILGLQNWASHEPAACIVTDEDAGDCVRFATIAEERLLRCKNSYQFPVHAVLDCMDRLGIESLREIDYLATDYSKLPRWINSGPHYRKLLHDYIKLKLDLPEERIVVVRHHDAHAAHAYYPSGFTEAAILVVDGVGSENETISLYRGEGHGITFVERATHYGLGAIYDAVTALLGLTGNHRSPQAGKLMGLAPYGAAAAGPILDIGGRYEGLRVDYSHFMSRLPFYRLKQSLVPCVHKDDLTNPYYSRIAFDVQAEIERALIHLARYALGRTGSTHLVMAGGTGLNCVANGVIVDQVPLDGFYVYPACSDEGIGLGAALYAYYNVLPASTRKRFVMPDAYTGQRYSQESIRHLLTRVGVPFTDQPPSAIARRIAAGEIVGWFTGGSEAGPRALGHRSILADPRDPKMKDVLNARVKHREHFRPFAPSVLLEYAATFFDLDRESPYMLLATAVREDKQALISAVVHVDGTSRIQTVSQEGGVFYEVIEEFRRLTGIPLVLNTSFNDNNEPIVETPEDALITFLSTEMDALYLEGCVVDRKDVSIAAASSVVSRLRAERLERRRERFRAFVSRCCRGWNTAEIRAYHSQELVRALWHRSFEAVEKLEQFVDRARRDQVPVHLVGTRDHTKVLWNGIRGFKDMKIAGVSYLDQVDWEDDSVSECELRPASGEPPSVVLITSYERQQESRDLARRIFGPDMEIVEPYLPWSENPRGLQTSADGGSGPFEDPGERVFFGDVSEIWPDSQVD